MEKITIVDKLNTAALMLVTEEVAKVKNIRKRTGYGTKPTFDRPFPIPTEYVEIDGVKVRYAKGGIKDGETVLLMSPLPQSIIAYAPIWKKLIEKFNVIAYDLPGFGGSEGGRRFMTFEAQGEFLKNFIEHFEIKNPHLVGPDVGMPAALYYTGSYENEVQSLIIGDGPAIDPSSNGSIINKMVYSGFWRLIMGNVGAGPFVEAGNQLCYMNYVPNAEEIADYKASYKGRIKPILEWFKGYPASLRSLDPILDIIEQPVLIFWGKNDYLLYVDNGERLSQRMRNASLHVFEDCGHFSYQDRHEAFYTMLDAWLREFSSRTQTSSIEKR